MCYGFFSCDMIFKLAIPLPSREASKNPNSCCVFFPHMSSLVSALFLMPMVCMIFDKIFDTNVWWIDEWLLSMIIYLVKMGSTIFFGILKTYESVWIDEIIYQIEWLKQLSNYYFIS